MSYRWKQHCLEDCPFRLSKRDASRDKKRASQYERIKIWAELCAVCEKKRTEMTWSATTTTAAAASAATSATSATAATAAAASTSVEPGGAGCWATNARGGGGRNEDRLYEDGEGGAQVEQKGETGDETEWPRSATRRVQNATITNVHHIEQRVESSGRCWCSWGRSSLRQSESELNCETQRATGPHHIVPHSNALAFYYYARAAVLHSKAPVVRSGTGPNFAPLPQVAERQRRCPLPFVGRCAAHALRDHRFFTPLRLHTAALHNDLFALASSVSRRSAFPSTIFGVPSQPPPPRPAPPPPSPPALVSPYPALLPPSSPSPSHLRCPFAPPVSSNGYHSNRQEHGRNPLRNADN